MKISLLKKNQTYFLLHELDRSRKNMFTMNLTQVVKKIFHILLHELERWKKQL